MKTKLLIFFLFLNAACAKKPEQIIESMKKAACAGDSKSFMGYIDKPAVMKNMISNVSEGNQYLETLATGMAVKMGEKIWANLETEANRGKDSELCGLSIRDTQDNGQGKKFVIQYANKQKTRWEVLKNETAGYLVTSILPYFDYLGYNWSSNRDTVKAKGSQGMTEVNLDSETAGLIELQYKNIDLLSGIRCEEAAFIFFDDKLASIVFICPQKSSAELRSNFEKMRKAVSEKEGKPAELADGQLQWVYVDTKLTLALKDDTKERLLMFTAVDKRVDINAELDKRKRK